MRREIYRNILQSRSQSLKHELIRQLSGPSHTHFGFSVDVLFITQGKHVKVSMLEDRWLVPLTYESIMES